MVRRMNRRLLAKRLGVALVVLFFVLLACELAARLVFPSPQYFQSLPFDPELGFRPPANSHLSNSDPAGAFPFRLNRLGFRGPDLPIGPKPAGTRRIVFLGDSFLVGWQVREADLVPFLTVAALAHGGEGVEAYNLACKGYGTVQQGLLLRRHGMELQPDDVVLCLYVGNDISDNSRAMVGRTQASPGGYLRPFLPPSTQNGEPYPDPVWLKPYRSMVRRHSRVFQLVEHRLLRRGWIDSYAQLEGVALDRNERVRLGKLPLPYLELFTPSSPPHWEVAWDDTRIALASLRDTAHALGAQFRVAIIPEKGQVQIDATGLEHDALLASAGQAPLDKQLDWNLPETRLRETLNELDIPWVSLLEPLRRETETTAHSMYHQDGHWNARGHRVAAREIVKALRGAAQARVEYRGTHPVDLPALVLAQETPLDFEEALHGELFGSGWHGWRSDWWGETHGWMMLLSGGILVPDREGLLIIDGWLPEFAELPATFLVNETTHVVENTGSFVLRQALARRGGESPYLTVRISARNPFPLMLEREAGLVLQGVRVEALAD